MKPRLAPVARENDMLLVMRYQYALERGLAKSEHGVCTLQDTVGGVTVGRFPDLYAGLARQPTRP